MVDGFVLLDGGPWDHAALALIVAQAGGRVSDGRGRSRLTGGIGIVSNGLVHDRIVAAIAGTRR